MKTQNPVREAAFNMLLDSSRISTDKVVFLNPELGMGNVQICNLEKGLQARLWDFYFPDDIELYNYTDVKVERPYYTLAYFCISEGIPLIKAEASNQELVIMDRLFLHALSEYKIFMPKSARGFCFSISFSKRWLCEALKGNKELEKIKRKICSSNFF